jgi:hypothetical protein
MYRQTVKFSVGIIELIKEISFFPESVMVVILVWLVDIVIKI